MLFVNICCLGWREGEGEKEVEGPLLARTAARTQSHGP